MRQTPESDTRALPVTGARRDKWTKRKAGRFYRFLHADFTSGAMVVDHARYARAILQP
jgi:hypothetical protein